MILFVKLVFKHQQIAHYAHHQLLLLLILLVYNANNVIKFLHFIMNLFKLVFLVLFIVRYVIIHGNVTNVQQIILKQLINVALVAHVQKVHLNKFP